MAIDEALYLLADPARPPVLRFYTWAKPTLSLGYFQQYKRVVSEPFLVHNNIDVVRRITGGRAVLHDKEVTYAVAGALTNHFANQSLQETYRLIAQTLHGGLESFGIDQASFSKEGMESARESRLPQCFVTVSPYEISRDTRKMIGSAQKRSRDRFIQHGSILLDFDVRLQNGCILHPDPDLDRKVAPLNRLLGRKVEVSDIVTRFTKAFEQKFQVTVQISELTDQERDLVASLEPIYQSVDWNQNGCR